ncbi:MAG: DUF1571 domain-containing protein [Planctomycetia bacterium]|nr:DUF1571 domain-containing protein [Planctomycetia bacterium]
MRSRTQLAGCLLALGMTALGCHGSSQQRVERPPRSLPRPNQLNPSASFPGQPRLPVPGEAQSGVVPASATVPAPSPAAVNRGLNPAVPEINTPAPQPPAAPPISPPLPGVTFQPPQPPAPPPPVQPPQTAAPGPAAPPVTSHQPARELTVPNPAALMPHDSPQVKLRQLHQRAAEQYAKIDSYVARLQRREQVNGKNSAEEVILFSHRKDPWSVHLKWIGTEAQGRESIYVKGKHEGKIHTLLAPSDPRILGKLVAMAPDSPFVRSRCRHPITEAGVGPLIDRFGRLLDREESRQGQALRSAGPIQRAEHEQPMETVEQLIAEREEPSLPGGGRRWWYFDPVTGFPTLIVTMDSAGQQVEYYCYDKFLMPAGLDDDDFNPDRLGKGRR